MSVRPAEQMLPPARTEADAKALRAFWRGFVLGVVAGIPLLRMAYLWGAWWS